MQRYPYIDILRGIAALLVIWYHVIENSGWTTFAYKGFSRLPRIGWLGVDLFLVISGFVIAKAAIEAHATKANWQGYFAERRVRRILPLYLATLVCYVAMVNPDVLNHEWDSFDHVASHLFLVHNLWPFTSGSINGPNWSVALEAQFYMLIVLVTPWLARTTWWRVLLTWVTIAVAWRYMTTLVWVPGLSDVNDQRVAATQLPGTLDQFGFGIALAKLAISGHLKFTPRRFAVALVIALLGLNAAWFIFWPRANYWYYPAMISLWRTLLSAGFAALLACVVMIPWKAGWFSWPFRYVGQISYGLYLWHIPVLMTLLERTPWKGYTLLCVTLVLTFILAALSWHGFEQLWMNPRKRAAPAATERDSPG